MLIIKHGSIYKLQIGDLKMAYNANIPQATDNPSQSQSQILGNFQAIQTLIGVNHENFGSAQEGNHFMVTWTDNTGSLPAAPTGTNLNIYNAKDAATVNQLYLQGPAATRFATAFPFTQCGASVNGWTYLPSGIIILWGNTALVGSSFTTISFTSPTFTGFPGFSNAFSAVLGVNNISNNINISSLSNTALQIRNNIATASATYFIVIGN